MAKATLVLFLLALIFLIGGGHDLQVGWQARSGPTPTPCEGPVESAYVELQDCYVDFREAVSVREKTKLERAFVPVRSAAGVETSVVLRLERGDPNFGEAQVVIEAREPSAVEHRAVKTLTLRAEISEMSDETVMHRELLSRRVRADYQLIQQANGEPPTLWWAITQLVLGIICFLFSAVAGFGLVYAMIAEYRKLHDDA